MFPEEGLNTYAVLDGASIPGLLDRLHDDEPEHACLAEYEIYDYPGEYVEHADDHLAVVRLDEIQTEHAVVRGNASARGLSAG